MRWTARRKSEFLATIKAAPERSVELMETHGVSAEELTEWLRLDAAEGERGLAIKALRRRTMQGAR